MHPRAANLAALSKQMSPPIVQVTNFRRHSSFIKNYKITPQVLRLDGWLAFMGDARLVDSQFTLSDATMAFLWSRMHVIDEIKDYAR